MFPTFPEPSRNLESSLGGAWVSEYSPDPTGPACLFWWVQPTVGNTAHSASRGKRAIQIWFPPNRACSLLRESEARTLKVVKHRLRAEVGVVIKIGLPRKSWMQARYGWEWKASRRKCHWGRASIRREKARRPPANQNNHSWGLAMSHPRERPGYGSESDSYGKEQWGKEKRKGRSLATAYTEGREANEGVRGALRKPSEFDRQPTGQWQGS